MFTHVLHATDFSPPAMRALAHAVGLATRFEARLTVLHAFVLQTYDPTLLPSGREALRDVYDRVSADLSRRAERAIRDAAGDIDVEPIVRRGLSAADVIVEAAADLRADLVVMGTRGYSPFRHFFLGSVAEKVVRHAPCPTLVVGRSEGAGEKYRDILVPVDFSDVTQSTLSTALALAREDGAKLHLLHVFEQSPPPPYEDVFSLDPELRERGEGALWKLVEDIGARGVTLVPHVREGRAARTIVQVGADLGADLILMGTHARRGVPHFLLGSVTARVLRRSPIPVLTCCPATARRMDYAALLQDIRQRWGSVRRHHAGYPGSYPAGLERDLDAASGEHLHVRPVRPDDVPALKRLYDELASDTLFPRFHSHRGALRDEMYRHLARVDYDDHLALLALDDEHVVGEARYYRGEGTNVAEAAVVVPPDLTGAGVAEALLDDLVAAARAKGVDVFEAFVFDEHHPFRRLAERRGFPVEVETQGTVVRLAFRLPDQPPAPA